MALPGPPVRDALYVALVIAASAVPYVARLGFYSDDWAFLGSLTTHGYLSSPGRSAENDFAACLRPRPVQVAYQTLLYAALDARPFGYHVVNTLVLAAMGALGYLVLRELGVGRHESVTVFLTDGDRTWIASAPGGAHGDRLTAEQVEHVLLDALASAKRPSWPDWHDFP